MMQLGTRIVNILVASSIPGARLSVFFSLMVVIWCIADLTRYLYYLVYNPFVIGKSAPAIFKWIRYTPFYFLYPLGYLAESIGLYHAAQWSTKEGLTLFGLPLSFAFYAGIGLLTFGLLIMYRHMIAQANKHLHKTHNE